MATLKPGIGALPEDIIYKVLHFVAQNEMPYRFPHPADHIRDDYLRRAILAASRHHCVLGWIRFGHVCNLWRRVTLASRSLWADSIGTLPAGVHEMMQRAGPHQLLSIHLYMGENRHFASSPLKSFLNTLVSGVDDLNIRCRLRAIYVEYLGSRIGFGNYPFNIVKALFSHDLPRFCHLEMSSMCTLIFEESNHQVLSLSIKSASTNALSLRGFFVRWHTPSLVSLSIDLSHAGNMPGSLPTVQTLVELLKPCASSLERIEIEGRAADSDDPPGSGSVQADVASVVDLPRLRYIRMFVPPHYKTPHYTEEVLGRLNYPSTALTRVDLPYSAYHSSLPLIEVIRAQYSDEWAAFRLHDGGSPDNIDQCYLDLYPRTSELLLALEKRPYRFHTNIHPRASFRILFHDSDTAKHILREFGIETTRVHCATFALGQSMWNPALVSVLASRARIVAIEGPSTRYHSVASPLSHPLEVVGSPHFKHLYLLARPGRLNEVDLAQLAAELGKCETNWRNVQLHLDAALHVHNSETHAQNMVQAQLSALFERVYWGEQLTGSVADGERMRINIVAS